MNTKIDNGGPAFPRSFSEDHARTEMEYAAPGMSLRDWFAGQIITGILLSPGQNGAEAQKRADVAAAWAYELADEMIKKRNEKT